MNLFAAALSIVILSERDGFSVSREGTRVLGTNVVRNLVFRLWRFSRYILSRVPTN